jgi:hypothetical protein
MKQTFLLILVFSSLYCSAQTGLLKGKIVHDDTKLPYSDVTVLLPDLKLINITNENGEFTMSNVPYGSHTLIFKFEGIEDVSMTINVSNPVTMMDIIELPTSNKAIVNNYNLDASALSYEDAGAQDVNTNSSSGQNISSVLNASRDPYLSAATFGWGQYFYRMRGYENENNVLFLNGVPMNDLEEGGIFFNSWSGLNDVFRGREVNLGLGVNEYNFGGIGLNTSLDATASNQRKGTRVTYTLTNRAYRNRLMLTHNSGLMKNGWAYSFSLSRRWAQEGYVRGTFFDAYAYFGSVEKRFKNHGINLMIVGSPTKRGKAGPASEEAFDLAGSNYYNPYWGFQNGKKRNSRIFRAHQPLFILSHDARLNSKTILNSAISYQFGEAATSGIDWYNAADPRPDYYRYMPSYMDSVNKNANTGEIIRSNPDKYLQIDWDRMYQTNYMNRLSGNPRSLYIVNENVENTRKINAAVNLESAVSNHMIFYSGLTFQHQKNHNFQRVVDLLGGSHWENVNQFAERQFPEIQNSGKLNANDKDVKRKVGDSYGFDYDIFYNKATWFAQTAFSYTKYDFFAAAELGYNSFFRDGNYLNGLYPKNSFGKSEVFNFLTYRVKAGGTYKLNGRNYIYANGSKGTRAPLVDNVIVSPRTRNLTIPDAKLEDITSGEIGYLLRSPFIKARFTYFITDIKNSSDIKRYYGDDSASFVNLAMRGINKRYSGIELGADIKISPSLSLNLAGAFTQAFYTSRPYMNIYSDNDTAQLQQTFANQSDTVYMKNYYVPSGPQTAMQAQLYYRAKRFWFATLSFNYLANNWMDFAPTRRTKSAVDLIPLESSERTQILEQRRIPSFYTVDLFFGKSFKVRKYIKSASDQTFLNVNLGITNLLNNRKIILYGFENLRYNRNNPAWFPPKYAHSLGFQYFLNIVLRF